MQTFIIEVFDDLTCLKEDVSAMLDDLYTDADIALSEETYRGHVAYVLGCLVFSLTQPDGLAFHALVADMLKFYRTPTKQTTAIPKYEKIVEFAELALALPAAISVQRSIMRSVGNYLHDRASIETEISITFRRLIVRVIE